MSDSTNNTPDTKPTVDAADDPIQVNEAQVSTPVTPGDAPAATPPTPEEESTIGTGTSMALGCIAATIVLIGIGLLFLAISTLF